MGFTLIEVLITITIVGILFSIGAKYFFEQVWHEHRINQQKYYLLREAQYALDSIINGVRKLKGLDYGYRVGGIIKASRIKKQNENEIWLSDPNNEFIGRILTNDPNEPTSLIFDRDIKLGNGNEFIIIPYTGTEAPFHDPYYVSLEFKEKQKNLLNINIKLSQKISSRTIEVEMHSAVNFRNLRESY